LYDEFKSTISRYAMIIVHRGFLIQFVTSLLLQLTLVSYRLTFYSIAGDRTADT